MPIVARLDELGRPAWILLMILGFMVWWPVGFQDNWSGLPAEKRTSRCRSPRLQPLCLKKNQSKIRFRWSRPYPNTTEAGFMKVNDNAGSQRGAE